MLHVLMCLALLATLTMPLLYPALHVLFFLPYLAACCYRHTRQRCTAHAIGCGLVIDCLSSSVRFGLYTTLLALTVWLCYPMRRHFFEERPSTLPLMTCIFSLCWNALFGLTACLTMPDLALGRLWIFTDLIGMAIIDALYAYVCFSLPLMLVYALRRRLKFRRGRRF